MKIRPSCIEEICILMCFKKSGAMWEIFSKWGFAVMLLGIMLDQDGPSGAV
jgi:hypothetical protein